MPLIKATKTDIKIVTEHIGVPVTILFILFIVGLIFKVFIMPSSCTNNST